MTTTLYALRVFGVLWGILVAAGLGAIFVRELECLLADSRVRDFFKGLQHIHSYTL